MTDFPALLPLPQNVLAGSGRLVLPATIGVYTGDGGQTWLTKSLQRFTEILTGKTGIEIKFKTVAPKKAVLTIAVGEGDYSLPQFGEDESYRLQVTGQKISITSATPHGVLHALQTLLQLVQVEDGVAYLPFVEIDDRPRFPWRGVKLDCVRHFIDLDTIKHLLDEMVRVKLNVLHLGLSNNQGFRVECKTFPKLYEEASNGYFYRQSELRNLITFAAERGVRIIPEFNMPGHSTCFLKAYPVLAAGKPPKSLQTTSGVFDDEMHPLSEATFTFIESFVAEMAALFPDPYWHFGGDEVTGKSWDQDKTIQQQARELGLVDNKAIQAHFTHRLLSILKRYGKIPIGWEEAAYGDIDPDTIIQSWMSTPNATHFSEHPMIISTGYYLDHFLKPENYYRNDPQADSRPSQTILGGEACIWTEVMDPSNLMVKISPNLAAIAERFWSSRDVTDIDDLYGRLHFPVTEEKIAGRVQTLRQLVAPMAYFFVLDRKENPIQTHEPLADLIHSLPPVSALSRTFEKSVEDFVAHGNEPVILQELLESWTSFGEDWAEVSETNPILSRFQTVADGLSKLAEVGLVALSARVEDRRLTKAEQGEADVVYASYVLPGGTPDLGGILEALKVRRESDLPLVLRQIKFSIAEPIRLLIDRAAS